MLTLDAIPLGKTVQVINLHHLTAGFRQRLLAMGLLPGTLLSITCIAPLGDPVQVKFRDCTLSLRKNECQQIEVEVSDEACNQHCTCK